MVDSSCYKKNLRVGPPKNVHKSATILNYFIPTVHHCKLWGIKYEKLLFINSFVKVIINYGESKL